MRHVSEHIRLLYNASALIKRPGLTGRYIRSKNSTSDEVESVQEYLHFDKAHVQEKLLQWHDDWAAQNQEGYSGRIFSSAATINVTADLTLRLATANMKRRRQLQYWHHHADVPETAPASIQVNPEVQSHVYMPSPAIDDATVPEVHGTAVSEPARSTKSKVSFSTAIVTELNDNPVPQTDYEESVVGSFKSTRVPPLPRVALKSVHFDCPYCGLRLESISMRSRRAWK